MKTIKLITMFVLFAGIFTFSACEPDNVINIDDVLGFARFEISTPDGNWDTGNGRIASEASPNARTTSDDGCSFEEVTHMVYVLQKNGITFPTEPMAVTKIGSKIVSAEVTLLYAGDYVIKEFYLTDALGNALFVVPMEGSDYAKYVKNPLEIPFTISKDETESITLEVVCLRDADGDGDGNGDPDPADFGYVTWEVYMVEVAEFAAAVTIFSCDDGKFIFADDAIFKIYNQDGKLLHELDQAEGTITFKTRLGELIRIVVEAYGINELVKAAELRNVLDNNNGLINNWQFGDATDCLTNACVIDYIHIYDAVVADESNISLKFKNVIMDHTTQKARLSITNWKSTAQRVKLVNTTGTYWKYFDLEAGETLWLTVNKEGDYILKTNSGTDITGSNVTVSFSSTTVETVERCDY